MSDIPASADHEAERIQRLKAFFSRPPELSVLRENEFCLEPTFFDQLAPKVLDIVERVVNLDPSPFRAEYLSKTAEDALLLSIRRNIPAVLFNSIALGSLAVWFVGKHDVNRGIILSGFARALRRLWQINKTEKDLEVAIHYFRKTVEFEPEEEQNRALHWDDLGCALWERYKSGRKIEDYEEAQSAFENAAEMEHSGKPMFISNLARLMNDRALSLSDAKKREEVLEESIKTHLKAITCVTPEFLGSIRLLHKCLAKTYAARYALDSKDPSGRLETEVREALDASGKRWLFFHELAIIYDARFNDSKRMEDANTAVELFRAADRDNPKNPIVVGALGELLKNMSLAFDSQEHLTEAIKYLSEAATAADAPSDDRSQIHLILKQLSMVLTQRFAFFGEVENIDKAIQAMEQALGMLSTGDPYRWNYLENLAVQLLYRYEATGQKPDLEKAEEHLRTALEARELTKDNRASCLRELGKALYNKYFITRDEETLQHVIDTYREAIGLWGDSHHSGVPLCYNDLGNAMSTKFQSNSLSDDICQAIDSYLKAIELIDLHPYLGSQQTRCMIFIGMANAHFLQFEMWKQADALDLAVKYYSKAVEATREGDDKLASRTGSLSWALQHKFDLTKEEKYLEAARDSILVLFDKPQPLRPVHIAFLQNRLGATFLRFYYHTKETSYLDDAADCFRKGTETACTDTELTNPPAINPARTLMIKYEVTQNDVDLAAAGMQYKKLMPLIPKLSPREGRGLLNNAGRFCTLIYEARSKISSIAAKPFGLLAIASYSQLLEMPSHVPGDRIDAALSVAHLAWTVNGDARMSVSSIASAVNLLPEAILMSTNRNDQLRFAREISWTPRHALAFSLSAGDSAKDTVRLFERARSIIWDRLIDQKTDVADLKAKHPELADKFEHLRDRLTKSNGGTSLPIEASSRIRQQSHNDAIEYNKMLDHIRKETGFENFLLLPQDTIQLQEYAAQGPIVILNVTEYRSDAIIIKHDDVVSVALPLFNLDVFLARAEELLTSYTFITTDPHRASQLLSSVLKWLWEAAACPVLDEIQKSAPEGLQRIWWMSNGWTSIFPIHAAGDHARALETGELCTVIDRVISSYIPTLKSLAFARKSAASASLTRPPVTALLVKMPTTPDASDLPHVEPEVSAVGQILTSISMQTRVLNRPKCADVKSALSSAVMVHFACHGTADNNDPSRSQLLLQDWKAAPLQVRAIMNIPMPDCQFVYLSACESAISKVAGLMDESIHITSAFQMAKVPYAVGTLWSIEDSLSVEVASRFYSSLIRGGNSTLDFSHSAEALHSTIKTIRARGVDPLLWGAYAHFGA